MGITLPVVSTRADGRAIDLVGVVGTQPSGPFHLTVYNDWKTRSVPNLDDRSKPRRPDWPPVSRRLEFRLATLPGVDPLARDFFADLYNWVAGEYQDRTDGPGRLGPRSAIGEGSRIMTPDHPDSKPGTKNGRAAHGAHIHWQVGPTGTQLPSAPFYPKWPPMVGESLLTTCERWRNWPSAGSRTCPSRCDASIEPVVEHVQRGRCERPRPRGWWGEREKSINGASGEQVVEAVDPLLP